MKKKYIAMGAVAAAGIAGAVALSQGALAYRGNPNQTGPNYNPERHEQMQKAFDNNDFNAWKEQMNGRGRMSQVVNEQNFSRFVEMRKLMLEKKYDEANQIRKEIGLGQGGGQGTGQGRNRANFVDKNGDGTCDNIQ